MFKKFSIILFSVFLFSLNANAGSDGKLDLSEKEQPKKIKDCFEKLNRATFSFNQALDKAIIKPIAKGYRNLPDPIQKGTSNAVKNLSNLITIPNNIWNGFKGLDQNESFIANCLDQPHDENEMVRKRYDILSNSFLLFLKLIIK